MTPFQTLTEKQAAEYLGVSISFLRRSRCPSQRSSSPEGPPYLKIGRAVRYDVDDLRTWRDGLRVDPTSEVETRGVAAAAE